MRKKLALIVALAALATSLLGAQSASASYLNVLVRPTFTAFCQPSPGTVGMFIRFKASVTAIGVSKPRKVRITFKVTRRGSKDSIRSGVVNLKRSRGYKADTKAFAAVAGEELIYAVKMSYTSGGSTVRRGRTYSSTTYTQAELDAQGVGGCG